MRASAASEPRARPAYAKASARSRRSASRGGGSGPAKRRARARVGESEGRSPSEKTSVLRRSAAAGNAEIRHRRIVVRMRFGTAGISGQSRVTVAWKVGVAPRDRIALQVRVGDPIDEDVIERLRSPLEDEAVTF